MDIIRTGDQPAGFGKNRIENLTDGIFAIALTLLVLGLEVPQTPEKMVPAIQLLIDLFPDFFHYILAFTVLTPDSVSVTLHLSVMFCPSLTLYGVIWALLTIGGVMSCAIELTVIVKIF